MLYYTGFYREGCSLVSKTPKPEKRSSLTVSAANSVRLQPPTIPGGYLGHPQTETVSCLRGDGAT
jgi:hypothetical protein